MSATTPEIEYRYLQATDYNAIVGVWTAAELTYRPKGRDSRERLVAELRRTPSFAFGALSEGKLIGTVIGTCDGRKGCVNRVAVVPEFRGKGIAQRLISLCEKSLLDAGAMVLFCLIEDYNSASQKLFEKVGYTCAEDVKYYSKRKNWDV